MGKDIKINVCVARDHDHYNDLVILTKIAYVAEHVLETELRGKENTETCTIKFNHAYDEEGYVIVRQNKLNRANYHFNLFIKNFMDDPLFRFDATGPSHRTKTFGIPLKARSVKTPHFNKYNSDGYQIAYRTEFIENYEKEILDDINFGLKHFSEECSLICRNRISPKILKQLDILSLFPEIDPHKNITFA